MTLTAKIRAWFRKEPEVNPPEIGGCTMLNCPCGYTTGECEQPLEAHIGMLYHFCPLQPPKPIVPIVIVPDLATLKAGYEQTKAAYEEALLEQLAGLKDE